MVIGTCVTGGYLYEVLAAALLRMLQNNFLVQRFKRHGVLLPSVGLSEKLRRYCLTRLRLEPEVGAHLGKCLQESVHIFGGVVDVGGGAGRGSHAGAAV